MNRFRKYFLENTLLKILAFLGAFILWLIAHSDLSLFKP
jgi:hypothetical protein